jgi:hypothetical protein
MNRAGAFTFALSLVLLLAAAPAFAQAAKKDDKAQAPQVKIAGVSELDVAEGSIPVDDEHVLLPFPGRRAANFYLVVTLKRLNQPKTEVKVTDLNVALAYTGYQPVAPYAVAVEKKYLVEGKNDVYAEYKYHRWVEEQYYFPVTKGQRAWNVTVDGKDVGSVAEFFTTLVIQGIDGVSTRIKLPDGNYQVLHGYQQTKIVLPAGEYDFVLEARGMGKVPLPWKKYDKGEIHYIAHAKDPQQMPVLPVERLKEALPKIYYAYKKFARKTGVGGGNYNIAGPGQKPVHVGIYFGRDGKPGPLWKCTDNRIEVLFDPDAAKKRSKTPPAVEYSEQYNRFWKLSPWAEAKTVYIEKDLSEVVGESVHGKLRIRSTERKPSRWNKDGLLEKGFLYDDDLGYFEARCKKVGDLYIVEGESSKGP